MKQISLTGPVLDKLKAALGADSVDTSKYAVYEAVALNTAPVRKRHPLYYQGRHTLQFLDQMHQQLSKETLPLQVQHNTDDLPTGRVFHSEVIRTSLGGELRVWFWVDKTNTKLVDQIDSGTIDQVSVSVMAETAKCSECGFDYLGEEATLDHIYSGTCPNGHVIGEGGVHAVMDSLSTWFELSLVGRGGAQGARILGQSDRRLAADGRDLTHLTLNYGIRKESKMDLNEFMNKLTDQATQIATLTASETSLKSKLAEVEAKLAEIQTKLTEAEAKLADKPAVPAEFTDVVRQLVAASGDVTAEVPSDLAGLKTLATAKLTDLKGKLVRAPQNLSDAVKPATNAFKRRTA